MTKKGFYTRKMPLLVFRPMSLPLSSLVAAHMKTIEGTIVQNVLRNEPILFRNETKKINETKQN